ncbi:TetR/AcrR family transcriptional regulator [Nocardia alni]|uniref:TetR/AcrR family transcriptional regulator n=1 Tax=Nocardia alni TaxID=2815723 RepID=UPI001C230857|nr:TetR/AcrR family transcriptional regulator [Nocardia alni]
MVSGDVARSPRGRGRPVSDGPPTTRQDILHAAREVFSEVGFQGATFKEIAARANVTRPAVNHYFKDKATLYSALFDSTQDEVVGVGLTRAAAKETLAAQLTAFLAAAVQADSQDRTYARFIASSLLDSVRHPEFHERAQSQLDGVRQFLGQAFDNAVRAGEITEDPDKSAVIEMLIAVMWGMGMYAGFIGSHEQLKSVVAQFTRLLEGSLW